MQLLSWMLVLAWLAGLTRSCNEETGLAVTKADLAKETTQWVTTPTLHESLLKAGTHKLQLANMYKDTQQPAKAAQAFQDAAEAFTEAALGQGHIMTSLVKKHSGDGQLIHSDAIDPLILLAIHAYTLAGEAHRLAAEAYATVNDLSRAANAISQAAKVCLLVAATYDTVNDPTHQIAAWKCASKAFTQAAVICDAANNYLAESEAYIQAALIYRALNSPSNEAWAYKLAAKACKLAAATQLGPTRLLQYKQAIKAYKSAAQAYAAGNEPFNEAETHKRIAEIYSLILDPRHQAKAYKRASKAFCRAAVSFHTTHHPIHAAEAYKQAAKTCHLEAEAYIQASQSHSLVEEEATLFTSGMLVLAAKAYARIAAICQTTHDPLGEAAAHLLAAETLNAAAKFAEEATAYTNAAAAYHAADRFESESLARKLAEAATYLSTSEFLPGGMAYEEAGKACNAARDHLTAAKYYMFAMKAYSAGSDETAASRAWAAAMACEPVARVQYQHACDRLAAARERLLLVKVLHVRRSHVLADTMATLMAMEPKHIQGLKFKIHFVGEEAQDYGGPLCEWFSLLSREMTEPEHAYFVSSNKLEQTFQPNGLNNDKLTLEHFRLFGIIMAMAVNSGHFVGFRLTSSLMKHMLGLPLSFDDLLSYDPDIYKQCQKILALPDPLVCGLNFAVHIAGQDVELCDHGNDMVVDLSNKNEYMALLTDMYLRKMIQPQLAAFLSGFDEVVYRPGLEQLSVRAFEFVLNGDPVISVQNWKQYTLYEGYNVDSEVVVWFWNVLSSFSAEQHIKLLQFVTGSPNVPVAGFAALDPMFTIVRIHLDDSYIPSASTCFHRLSLPIYTSELNLKAKLIYAINEANEGFGFI